MLNRRVMFKVGLAIYAMVLFLLMTFYRLPPEKIFGTIASKVTRGQLLFAAERVFSSFPPGYRLEGISYGLSLGDAVAKDRIESLNLRPVYGSLFLGYLPVRFRGILPHGTIDGETGISMTRGAQRGYLALNASEVQLEDFRILRSLTDRNIKGKLDADIKMNGNLTEPSEMNGAGRFLVEKGSIDTRLDVAGLKTVPFENIKSSFTIKDGVITLNNTEMDGPMFSGNLSGEIRLQKDLAASLLNVTARMIPGALLEGNPLASQFLAKIRKGKDPVVLKLEGSLGRPSVTWGKV
jgi:type II secretion system protein N